MVKSMSNAFVLINTILILVLIFYNHIKTIKKKTYLHELHKKN